MKLCRFGNQICYVHNVRYKCGMDVRLSCGEVNIYVEQALYNQIRALAGYFIHYGKILLGCSIRTIELGNSHVFSVFILPVAQWQISIDYGIQRHVRHDDRGGIGIFYINLPENDKRVTELFLWIIHRYCQMGWAAKKSLDKSSEVALCVCGRRKHVQWTHVNAIWNVHNKRKLQLPSRVLVIHVNPLIIHHIITCHGKLSLGYFLYPMNSRV